MPSQLYTGLIISGCSALLLLAVWFLDRRLGRRRPAPAKETPEAPGAEPAAEAEKNLNNTVEESVAGPQQIPDGGAGGETGTQKPKGD